LALSVGRQEENPAHKNCAGVVICLNRSADDLHYGPSDATATPSSFALLKSGIALPFWSLKRGRRQMGIVGGQNAELPGKV